MMIILSMKDMFIIIQEMDMDSKCGLTDQNMKVIGLRTRPMEKDASYMPMGMYMKENGAMIRRTALENTHTLMEQNMKVNGSKINKMEKAWKSGQMALFMKEITWMG